MRLYQKPFITPTPKWGFVRDWYSTSPLRGFRGKQGLKRFETASFSFTK